VVDAVGLDGRLDLVALALVRDVVVAREVVDREPDGHVHFRSLDCLELTTQSRMSTQEAAASGETYNERRLVAVRAV
jgi:hypothetical protein